MPVCGWLIDAGGRQFPLDQIQSLQIGRDPANGVVLNDVSVSRSHAEIFFQGSLARVRDLGSANGTFVDGTRIRDSALYDGQSVRIGSVGFTYRSATNDQQQTVLISDQPTTPGIPPRTNAQPLRGIFCQSCGSSNKASAAFCTKCGSSLTAVRQAEVQSVYRGPQVQYIATSSANAGLAAVLSFFWCGLGHIYAGKIGKGILLMLLYPCFFAFGYLLFLGGLIAAASSGPFFSLIGLVFLVCAAIVWVYGMVDSYNLAKRASVATISRVQVTPF
jgi:pSer/pThr/pTyr-binding forkhead associated (FHA) protein